MTTPFTPQLLHCPSWYSSPDPPLDRFPADKWVLEPKLDGRRFVFHITSKGTVEAYGRIGRRYGYNLPATLTRALLGAFPRDTIVDTELVVPGAGRQSTEVSTVLANPGAGTLRAYAFDLMRFGGYDTRSLKWSERRQLLEMAFELLEFTDAWEYLQPTVAVDPSVETFKRWIEHGAEGAVLKRRASSYSSGARNCDWIKLKPLELMES